MEEIEFDTELLHCVFLSSRGTARNYSSSPEGAQILTLSDLTPPVSSMDSRRTTTPANPGNYSFKSSLPDIRNGSSQSSPRDAVSIRMSHFKLIWL